MEDKRTKTLDALSTFIQSQRTLLAQTLADIDKLQELRNDIALHPDDGVEMIPHFVDQLNASTSKLSDNIEVVTEDLPEGFDWSLFSGQDPAPFKALASSARQAHTQRNEPKDSPSTPTSVQQYIRDQKRLIIDPVIASLPVLSSDSEEEPPDPEELRRIQEREKIRDLKKRRINGGGSVFGGLGLRKPADAVYVRMDQADESAEVDIWGGGGSSVVAGKGTPQSSIADTHDDNLDMDPGNADGPSYGGKHFGGKSWPIPEPSPKITRQRVPTRKASATVSSSSRSSRAKSKQAEVPALDDEVEDEGDDDRDTRATKEVVLDKKGKPRPETYKQAWSVSEQHLLEQLLEQIPDGEKNRWAKISKAMNGRRTARQVASRVQKYYEKLKRFGVEVGQS